MNVHLDYSQSYGQPLSTRGGFNSCETYYDSKSKTISSAHVSCRRAISWILISLRSLYCTPFGHFESLKKFYYYTASQTVCVMA